MTSLYHCLLVFVGGGLGALSRHGVACLGFFDENPYYYTVAINITGCTVIGVLWALFQHYNVPQNFYLLCIVGFLGGYTTYSAFTLDAMRLVQDGHWLRALFYIGITLIGGLGGCALGLFLTQKLLK